MDDGRGSGRWFHRVHHRTGRRIPGGSTVLSGTVSTVVPLWWLVWSLAGWSTVCLTPPAFRPLLIIPRLYRLPWSPWVVRIDPVHTA